MNKHDFSVRIEEKSRIIVLEITKKEMSFIIGSMLKINLLTTKEFITKKSLLLT